MGKPSRGNAHTLAVPVEMKDENRIASRWAVPGEKIALEEFPAYPIGTVRLISRIRRLICLRA